MDCNHQSQRLMLYPEVYSSLLMSLLVNVVDMLAFGHI